MTVTLEVLRGDSIVFEVEFFTDTEATVPWNDVEDFAPFIQVRTSPHSDEVVLEPSLSFDANVMTVEASSTDTAALSVRTYYWDVQFTDPDAAPGYGEFSWPEPGQKRHRMIVGGDVSQVQGS